MLQLMHRKQALLPSQGMHDAELSKKQLPGTCGGHQGAQGLRKPAPQRLLSISHLQRHLPIAILLQGTTEVASVISVQRSRHLRGRRRQNRKAPSAV